MYDERSSRSRSDVLCTMVKSCAERSRVPVRPSILFFAQRCDHAGVVRRLLEGRIIWALLVHFCLQFCRACRKCSLYDPCFASHSWLSPSSCAWWVTHPAVPKVFVHTLPCVIRSSTRTVLPWLPDLEIYVECLLEACEHNTVNMCGNLRCLGSVITPNMLEDAGASRGSHV